MAAIGMLMAGTSGALAPGSATDGTQIFQSQRAMREGVTPGAMDIGPSLAGIYNRPVAATVGYQFSPALKNAHTVWSEPTLDKFIAALQSKVPATKMLCAGLSDIRRRAGVIA